MTTALLTAAFVTGLVWLSYGAWLAYEPAGFIVAGLILVVASLAYATGSRR